MMTVNATCSRRRAGYIERCTSGSGRGVRKPTAARRKGAAHPTSQEIAYGGLSNETRLKMRAVLDDHGFDENGCRTEKKRERGARQATDAPIAGTKFVRTWNGQRYEVTAISGGFEYDGRRYRSLTAVAKAITGTHWNGRLFFGLKRTAKGGGT